LPNGTGARAVTSLRARAADPRGIWWVDDLGSWNPADPKGTEPWSRPSIRGTLEHSLIAYSLLGMVKLLVRPSRVAIKWDLRRVAPESLESVLDYLDDQRAGRKVSLIFFYEGWNAEVWDNEDAAVRRIRQVSAYRDVWLSDHVWVRPTALDRLPRATALLQAGFKTWERSGGRLDLSRHPGWRDIVARLLIYRPGPRDEGLMLVEAGAQADCLKVFDPRWKASARNRAYDYEYPSRRYSDRVAPAYARALETEEPWLDHVRALIPRGEREPAWAPYQRLVLPVRLADGAPAIACLCNLTQDVDIPFLGWAA